MRTGWDQAFKDYSCDKLGQLTERICACLDRLNPDQIWHRGNTNENAIGNLVLHLCGNVRQWIGSGIDGQTDIRKREDEFAARGGSEGADLKEFLRATVAEAVRVIRGLTPERLEEVTSIQTYEVTVLQAVYHVVEHFSGHTGQIIFSIITVRRTKRRRLRRITLLAVRRPGPLNI
jgi:uncharacterized damage-inducible protein DinB